VVPKESVLLTSSNHHAKSLINPWKPTRTHVTVYRNSTDRQAVTAYCLSQLTVAASRCYVAALIAFLADRKTNVPCVAVVTVFSCLIHQLHRSALIIKSRSSVRLQFAFESIGRICGPEDNWVLLVDCGTPGLVRASYAVTARAAFNLTPIPTANGAQMKHFYKKHSVIQKFRCQYLSRFAPKPIRYFWWTVFALILRFYSVAPVSFFWPVHRSLSNR
jgi:hypothetical protein